VGGRIGHAPSAARRTQGPAFTGEGQKTVTAAAVAVQSKKTVSENSAVQIGAEFALDEAGHGRAIAPRSGEEGLELLPDDFVKERLLGLVAFVLDGEGSVGTGAKRRGERLESCLLEGVQASGVLACTGPRASHRETTASSRSASEKFSNAHDDLKMTWSKSARHPEMVPG